MANAPKTKHLATYIARGATDSKESNERRNLSSRPAQPMRTRSKERGSLSPKKITLVSWKRQVTNQQRPPLPPRLFRPKRRSSFRFWRLWLPFAPAFSELRTCPHFPAAWSSWVPCPRTRPPFSYRCSTSSPLSWWKSFFFPGPRSKYPHNRGQKLKKKHKKQMSNPSIPGTLFPSEREIIDFVLRCFEDMGATEEDLHRERSKLNGDADYFRTWCTELHEWCTRLES